MMAAERVGDMTMDELEQKINQVVNARMRFIDRTRLNELSGHQESRSVDEILESIRKRRRVPAPGTPSTLELLREDRDR